MSSTDSLVVVNSDLHNRPTNNLHVFREDFCPSNDCTKSKFYKMFKFNLFIALFFFLS